MTVVGFSSFSEVVTYVTFVFLGLSIMMATSSITSAPGFINDFYKYATGLPDAVPENPSFWKNAQTYFNVATFGTQGLCEPLALTPWVRRLPIRPRLIFALLLPFAEILIIILVPVFKVKTQASAIAVFMVVGCIGGVSKAICDTSTNALVGPFPTKFMNGAVWGLTVASLITSILQVIIMGSMDSDFSSMLTQSRIYFGVALFIQFCAISLLYVLNRNPFAKKYIAEFRNAGKRASTAVEADDAAGGENAHAVQGREPIEGTALTTTPTKAKGESSDSEDAGADGTGAGAQAVSRKNVLTASGDADHMQDADQVDDITSAQQMMNASLFTVLKKVYPMLFCCFLVFFTTLLIWPGAFIYIGVSNKWYPTIMILLFNVGDFAARIVLMFRRLRPSPLMVVIGSVARVIIVVPLLVLCIRGIIPGLVVPYLLSTFHGLTNGYFGAMAMIHGPRTPSLSTAGERSLAAICSGVFVLFGLAAGAFLALAVMEQLP